MSIAKEGIPFILAPLVIGAFLIYLGGAWAYPAALFIAIGLFSAFFFRDPSRKIPASETSVIGPADGVVMEVTTENGKKVMRMFLSVFNVHIQRAPVAGKVTKVEYRPGKFVPANNPEAHSINEQNVITIETKHGDFIVKQVAGIIARRVVARVKPGDVLKKGDQIGLIRFGSQVDIHVPDCVAIQVKPGDKIIGGETIVGEITC
jgi:phosphatidylserine decarboxylase